MAFPWDKAYEQDVRTHGAPHLKTNAPELSDQVLEAMPLLEDLAIIAPKRGKSKRRRGPVRGNFDLDSPGKAFITSIHELVRPKDAAATICSTQSDLNSNAFYWETSPLPLATDYSTGLEKTLSKKAPRLLEHIHALNVDDPSVILAVKELVCTNEKVSTILKVFWRTDRRLLQAFFSTSGRRKWPEILPCSTPTTTSPPSSLSSRP